MSSTILLIKKISIKEALFVHTKIDHVDITKEKLNYKNDEC